MWVSKRTLCRLDYFGIITASVLWIEWPLAVLREKRVVSTVLETVIAQRRNTVIYVAQTYKVYMPIPCTYYEIVTSFDPLLACVTVNVSNLVIPETSLIECHFLPVHYYLR